MDLFNYQLKCTILLISFQLQLFRWAKSSKNWIKNNPGMGQTKAMRFCIFNTCQLDRLTRGGIPRNSRWRSTTGFPKSWPYFRPKNVISTPVFSLGSKIHSFFRRTWAEITSSLVRSERQQKKILKIHFEFAYFSRFLFHLDLKQQIRSYTPVVPSKAIPNFRPKWAKSLPVFKP